MARCQPSIWIHHLKQLLWLISLVEISRGQGGNSKDVAVYCPAQPFVDGEVIIVTCEINQTSISNAGCLVSPKRVDFKVILNSGPWTLCSPDYPPSPSSCAQNTTKGACFCADQNGDIYTYQYNLIGNLGHQGGNITCDLCALPQTPLNRSSSSNCTSITFASTTAAAAGATTAAGAGSTTAAAAAGSTTTAATTEGAEWKIIISVILPILFIATVIIVVVSCKWKRLLCFENKTVDPTRTSNECHQNDLRSGKPDASSASAPPDQSSLKKSKTTNSEKTGSQHVASEKSPPKEHSTRKETALDLTELNSGSATSEESASNIVAHQQLRPLPTPNLTSVERNSSVDPFRQTNPLPEISGRLKQ